MSDEEEEDYMSDAFLSKMQDVKPGVSMLRRQREALRKEVQQEEVKVKNRQKSVKQQEEERREEALHSSISSTNSGFTLLQRMGYRVGQGLGKDEAGRVDPIPLNIKTGRGGLGMEEVKKRKMEEEFERLQQRKRTKEQNEKKTVENFRSRVRTERDERRCDADFRRSQRACEQLDSQKGVSVPRQDWFWPKTEPEEEPEKEEEEEEEEEEELTSFDKLHILTSYLRGVHFYCVWCGTAFNDEDDLSSNCPGDTAAHHD